ncbi:hypothetical protein R3P38DRAFT_3239935 [Favolaschia claudopus]|uniref:F-box domain-containing protein n=1 Tax=Favolaschia claudopus TaxID=2862362 RepID=A0AAV9Z8I3_9AGAR
MVSATSTKSSSAYRGMESLPFEVVSRALRFHYTNPCFTDIQSVIARYCVMSVCCLWSAAVVGDPSSWAQQYIALNVPIDVLLVWLGRAGTLRFTAVMDFRYDRGQRFDVVSSHLEQLFKSLRGPLGHCRALRLRVIGGKLCDRVLSLLLPISLPSLTRLDLDIELPFEFSFFDFARAKRFTTLTTLHLFHTFPSGDWEKAPLLPGVTTVKLAAIDDFCRPMLHDFHSFLSTCYKDEDAVVPSSCTMQRLTRLEFSSDTTMHSWLLASLDAPMLAHLTLHTDIEEMLAPLSWRCRELLETVTSLVLWAPVRSADVLEKFLTAMPSLTVIDGRYSQHLFSGIFYRLAMKTDSFLPRLKLALTSHLGIALVQDVMLARHHSTFAPDFQLVCVTVTSDLYHELPTPADFIRFQPSCAALFFVSFSATVVLFLEGAGSDRSPPLDDHRADAFDEFGDLGSSSACY